MLALLGILSICHAEGEATVISADRIVVSGEQLVAQGDVELDLGQSAVACETLQVSSAPNGMPAFSAEGVRWTPCRCDNPPWALRAQEAAGVVGEVVSLRKAALEFCGAPILPVPWLRIPLKERSVRLLFPEVGHGLYGMRIGAPLWVPIARESALVLTPEYRRNQAIRQRARLSGPAGEAALEMAHDFRVGENRGQARANAGVDNGKQRLAINSQWVTDEQYLPDYGADFFSRTKPFSEHLMVAAAGPVRLESNSFDRGAYQRPVGVVFSVPGEAIGPIAVDAQTRVDWVEMKVDDGFRQEHRGDMSMALRTGHSFGIIEGQVGLDARAVQWTDGGPWSQAISSASMMVPMWGRIGNGVHMAEVGWMGAIASETGVLEDRFDWLNTHPAWRHGPTLRSTFVGKGGVPFSSELGAYHSAMGWNPMLASEAKFNHISARIQADRELQYSRIGYGNAVVAMGAGLLRTEDLLQSMADTGLQVGTELQFAWTGLYDHNQQRWMRQGPSIVWNSKCDCLSLEFRAEWANDREFPEGSVRLDLQPKRMGDSP